MIDPFIRERIAKSRNKHIKPELKHLINKMITLSRFLIENGFPENYKLTPFTITFIQEAGRRTKAKHLSNNLSRTLEDLASKTLV